LWVNLGQHWSKRSGPDREGTTTVQPQEPQATAGAVDQVQPISTITTDINDALLEKKVFLATGTSFGSEQPGWFRIVFSQKRDILEEGLRRIEKALALDEGISESLGSAKV
jgi:aspartate/methionine/tyrosine aminotransferase